MKKVLSAILATVLSIALFGCSDAKPDPSNQSPDTESREGVNVQENGDKEVEISIPLSLMEKGATSELTQEEKDNGFLTKNVTGDYVKYTIKKSKYESFMKDYKKTVEESLNEMVTSGTYKSVKFH